MGSPWDGNEDKVSFRDSEDYKATTNDYSASSERTQGYVQSRPITCNDDVSQKCPFDDLSAEEIEKVITIIKEHGTFPAYIEIAIIRQQEPKKADWIAGKGFGQRNVYCALFDPKENFITEITIDLKTEAITERHELAKGITPQVLDSG